jgi:intein-encoded DNA endonuclease-like protein
VPIYKKVNKDFFKKWTPEMAYVLGFFAADGYMTANKRGAHFWNIHINDLELLKEIKRVIESEHKISVKNRKGGYTGYRIQIGSNEMYEDLYKLGMRQNKTKSLAVPEVPNKYLCHFLRGYFDGDGHVWVGWIHKGRNTQTYSIQTVFTSCSYDFLEKLRKRLEASGVERGRLRKGKGDYYRLVYSVLNSLKLYEFMYNELGFSGLFLKRKKVVFEKYLKMRV